MAAPWTLTCEEEVMKAVRYKPVWTIKYLLPFIFSLLFVASTYSQFRRPISANQLNISDIIIMIAEFCVLCFMLYFFTVEYEIRDNKLIIYSFFWRMQTYAIHSIQFIEEDAIYHFMYKIPYGPGLIILNLRNGKRVFIIGLTEQLKFIQKIREIQNS